MQLYGIRRRNGWATAEDLEAAAARSTEEGDKEGLRRSLDPQLRRSPRRAASSARSASTRPTAPRRSAPTPSRVGMPADEIIADRRHGRRARPGPGAGRGG